MTEKIEIDRKTLEEILLAIRITRKFSVDGAMEGYNYAVGNWAEELYRSHGGLTKSIVAIEAVLSEP